MTRPGHAPRPWTAAALGLAAVAVLAAPAAARQLSTGGGAVGVLTRVDPAPGDVVRTEARVVQPALAAHWQLPGGQLALSAMLNGEGATIDNGELAPGNWGEGYFDRRHPHTWAHELVLEGRVRDRAFGLDLGTSFAVGKGFVPFGTDDPMNRPAIRYPVNHHLAQILERAITALGLRLGPAMVEATLFNGDEPEEPDQWPNWERFGDSWAIRLTAVPVPGLEAQASYANVASPEFRTGVGPGQEKWSASARWVGRLGGGSGYAMLEWARTEEVGGFFEFRSVLAEGEWTLGRHRPYYRWERTERPEEERTTAFRSRRPHHDDSILGTTRWTVNTAGYGFTALQGRGWSIEPVVEASLAAVEAVGPGAFDPVLWYGSDTIVSLTVGVAVRFGIMNAPHRMGRYGVARAGHAIEAHPHPVGS